jgi:hypothetical protein
MTNPWDEPRPEITIEDLANKIDLMYIAIDEINKKISSLIESKEPKKEEPKPVEMDKLTIIRKMAQNIIMDGRDAEIKKLFADYGIKKLSELNADKYDDFIRILGGM